MRWSLGSNCVIVAFLISALAINSLPSRLHASDADIPAKRLDVNDISILWPVPKTAEEVTKLIAVDEELDDGTTAIWPEAVFKKVVDTAQTVSLTGSGGASRQIKFRENKAAFEAATTWKIVGIRVDPSAPGCSDKVIRLFGSTPQIRLVVQPVTVKASKVVVHDFTAHLVFDFISGSEPPSGPGLPARGVPDRVRFKAILDELVALKAELLVAGVTTDGDLGVHPALKASSSSFSPRVKAFLKKHLTGDRLNAVAFMGLDFPEPWIFFAMAKRSGEFERVAHPSLQPEKAQMLTFRGGDRVMPHPINATFGKGVGVSTARLFEDGLDLDSAATTASLPPRVPAVAFRDVPDIIANPQISHFFSTDCLSCHSESAHRARPEFQGVTTQFQFRRPMGVSGVSSAVLPNNIWNVRCFGWFPDFFNGGKAVESVAMRTANEAAESADFINREYFGAETPTEAAVNPPNVVPSSPQPAAARTVANALTLVMTIKSPQDREQLKELVTKLQKLPPDKNPITVALTKLGNVHFARFVFIGDDKLAVITTYDDDFETYIQSFVDEIGGVFDQLLAHMKDAPPLPVKDNAEKFLEYVRKNDLTCEPPFFSAYPTLRVQDILTLQKGAKK